MADTKTEVATTAPQAAGEVPAPDRFEGSNYAVDREIARGGMGRIIVADDLAIGRRVAIKELLLHSPGTAARFEREARLTARLQHPAIVPIYEIGQWADGTPYYTMRMVEGKTLRQAIAECDSLASRLQLLPALTAAAEAIAFAHSKKVIHRDLSPNNVLVGAFGETVVIDWGIAKVVDDHKSDAEQLAEDLELRQTTRRSPSQADLTVEGSLLGTLGYMPLEQAMGLPVDTRADVYTLGALLYHLLAGKPPYAGPDVLEAVHAGPPPDLADIVPEALRDLRSIVAMAMARSAGDRYRDAGLLVEELRRFQTGAIVHAHRYTRRERLRRWTRRRRGILIGAAAALIGAGVATALVFTVGKDEAPGPTCAELAPVIDDVWNPAKRKALESAFGPFAVSGNTLVTRVATAIDDYAAEIRRTSIESCEATRQGVQTAEVGANRSACLEERVESLRALIGVLQTPTPALIDKNETAVLELERAGRCSDRAAPVPAVDPTRLREVRQHIAKATALVIAGEPVDSVVEAQRAVETATELGWPGKIAEARGVLGNALVSAGRMAEAEPLLKATVSAAIEHRRDDLAAATAFATAILEATGLGKFDEARVFIDLGLAFANRIGHPQLQLSGLHASGLVYLTGGDPLRSVAASREALAIADKYYGHDHPVLFAQEAAYGAALSEALAVRSAIPHLERARALRLSVAGPDDVSLTAVRAVLAMAYALAGEFDKAHREIEIVIEVRGRLRNGIMAAAALDTLAEIQRLEGKLEQALTASERCLRAMQILGKSHVVFTQVATTKARILLALDRRADARALLDEIAKAAAADNPHVSKAHAVRAELAVLEGAWVEAETAASLAIAGLERFGGLQHPELWRPLTALARARLELGHPEEAKPLIERARAIAGTTELTTALAPLTELAKRL